MKIKIYDEPRSEALGGTEVYAAVLAGALATEGHAVEILHHRRALSAASLGQFAAVDLKDVSCRFVPSAPIVRGAARESWARYREELEQERSMTEGCDLFISLNHETVPFCSAPLGVLIVLFPFYNPAELAGQAGTKSVRTLVRARLQSRWHQWKLGKRLRSYQVKTAISEFSGLWTERRWGVKCEILYPPVELDLRSTAKTNRILSVGRFATGRHGKNQLEMLEIFGHLKKAGWEDWQYDCVGARGFSNADLTFFEEAETLAARVGAEVTANIDRARLCSLYREAKIFWHAAGMKSDEEKHPELAEHFGITTVEAMSAGCVPVVVNKGGQPEIVEHGVSGFVWNTVEELQEYSARLMLDDQLCSRMSEAARKRAQMFGRQAFLGRFEQLLRSRMSFSAKFATGEQGA